MNKIQLKTTAKLLLLVVSVIFGGSVFALPEPVGLLKEVTQGVINELNAQGVQKENTREVFKIVDARIIPHADFEEMAQWVSGRNAWLKASPKERQAFIKEFKVMVVRTYANALLTYSKQKIDFAPLREDWRNKQRVQVQSTISERGKNSLHVDYKLVRRNDDWRVYDIVIEGVSLIKGYTAQFGEDIRQKGLTAVTAKIAERNLHVDQNG